MDILSSMQSLFQNNKDEFLISKEKIKKIIDFLVND